MKIRMKTKNKQPIAYKYVPSSFWQKRYFRQVSREVSADIYVCRYNPRIIIEKMQISISGVNLRSEIISKAKKYTMKGRESRQGLIKQYIVDSNDKTYGKFDIMKNTTILVVLYLGGFISINIFYGVLMIPITNSFRLPAGYEYSFCFIIYSLSIRSPYYSACTTLINFSS